MDKVKLPLFKMLLFSIIPLVALLLLGELFFRVRMYLKYNETYYLTAPFFKKVIEVSNDMVSGVYDVDHFPQGYFKVKPGSYPSFNKEEYEYYTVNSLGFRGKEFAPFDKEKIRVFAIGGSSTFCAESGDEDTWPVRLGYYLGDRFEVINSGFPFYRSTQFLNLIKYELIDYKPDIFIIYSGFNDLLRTDTQIFAGLALKVHNLFYLKSMLYTSVVEKLGVMFRGIGHPTIMSFVGITDTYINNLNEIRKICLENDIELIFVRQMINAPKELFLNDGPPLNAKVPPRDEFGKMYAYNSMIYYHNEEMRQLKSLSAKYNVKFLDFRKKFYDVMDNRMLFYDWIHLMPEGNDFLARLVSDIIKRRNN